MSRIVTEFKCEHCKEIIKAYVSFGHPEKDFIYTWICGKCRGENKMKIKAMPHDYGGYV